MARETHKREGRPQTAPWRALGLCLVVACALWAGGPARSAELTAVRVGSHPTFTRVVFEFDAPTGYRIERVSDGGAASAIVVTLDAEARPREIVSSSPGVASVSVESDARRAIARIVTREPGLPIKEMILTNPPRIVLDLLTESGRPEPVRRAPEAQQPIEAAAEPVAPPPAPVEQPAVDDAAIEAVAPEAAPSGLAEPLAPPGAESAFESEEIEAPEADVADAVVEAVEPAADAEAEALELVAEVEAEALEPVAEVEAEPLEPVADGEEAGLAREVAPAEPAFDAESPPAIPPAPEPEVARRLAPAEPARPAAGAGSPELPFEIETVGAVAGGVLALLAVLLFVMRRRRALPRDLDVTALAAAEEDGEAGSDEGRIPRGGFSVDVPPDVEPSREEDFELGVGEAPSDEDKPIEKVEAEAAGSPGLFEETPKEEDAKTMDIQDLPISSQTDSEAPTQLGIGAGVVGLGEESGIARIVQDLERRIAHLEARLDESNEARERLERQVSTQTEELRVQRAAIARTQRALRSLSRSDEEQATEPAPRDPSTPVGSR